MLYITVNEPKDFCWDTKGKFRFCFNPEWLASDLAKEIVHGVDKSEVLSPYCIQSPILGQIAPYYLSGGTKSLLIVLNNYDITLGTASFGDNCAPYLLKIAEKFDFTLYLNSYFRFMDCTPNVICKETGEHITTHKQWDNFLLEYAIPD